MAEAILKSKQLQNVHVRSGGIYAAQGAPMSTNAQLVLNEQGIPHQHYASQVTVEDLQWADLIITMTNQHKKTLVQMMPTAIEKTFTLKEFTSSSIQDVVDPYGGSIEMYRATFQELQQHIEQMMTYLQKEWQE